VEDELRGSEITSYYLQWDKGTDGITWYDLVGLTESFTDLEYTATYGDILPGEDYQFRLKAENEFGLSTDWSPITTITANSRPDPVAIPTTVTQDSVNVRISWTAPSDNYSPLLEYEILVKANSGVYYAHSSCSRTDPTLTYCDVSVVSLREGSFLLTQGSIVKVKVRALNAIEWGDYSQVNLVGALIFVEPYMMTDPYRGDTTSETLIEVSWLEIEALSLNTGGSPIDSYNLSWKV
jgi:hypothetical protein